MHVRKLPARKLPVRLPVRVIASLLLTAATAGSAGAAPPTVGSQLRFGTKMAQRGLWHEALFRFRQAERIEPGNSRVLNNIAVALEAVGEFEQAEATYQRAAKLDAQNQEVKKNLARFVEFYQGYKPKAPAATAPQPSAGTTTSAAPVGTTDPAPPDAPPASEPAPPPTPPPAPPPPGAAAASPSHPAEDM